MSRRKSDVSDVLRITVVGGFVVLAPLRNYGAIVDNCVLENDVHAHGANCINCPLSFDLLFCVWFCL